MTAPAAPALSAWLTKAWPSLCSPCKAKKRSPVVASRESMTARAKEALPGARAAISRRSKPSQTSAAVIILLIQRLSWRCRDQILILGRYVHVCQSLLHQVAEGRGGHHAAPGHVLGLVDLHEHRNLRVVQRRDSHKGGDVGARLVSGVCRGQVCRARLTAHLVPVNIQIVLADSVNYNAHHVLQGLRCLR